MTLLIPWWWRHHRRALRAADTYAPRVLALSPLAYYQLAEASGTTATDSSGNGYDGDYVNAVPGATGIGDGNTAGTFDGTGDVVTIGAVASHIDGDEGTILVWANTAAWADGTARFLVRLKAASGDEVYIQRTTVTHQLGFRRIAATSKLILDTSLAGATAYFSAALTWSVGSDALKAYINGAQVGSTQTGLDVFDGPPASTSTLIGAGTNGGANSWSGAIAHVAIWTRALSGAEILSLGVLAAPSTPSTALLTEAGDYLVTENGAYLIQE